MWIFRILTPSTPLKKNNYKHSIHKSERKLHFCFSLCYLVWKRVRFQFLNGIPTLTCVQDHLVILSQALVSSFKGHPARKPLCLQTNNNWPITSCDREMLECSDHCSLLKNIIKHNPSMTYDLCDMFRTTWTWSFATICSLHFSNIASNSMKFVIALHLSIILPRIKNIFSKRAYKIVKRRSRQFSERRQFIL